MQELRIKQNITLGSRFILPVLRTTKRVEQMSLRPYQLACIYQIQNDVELGTLERTKKSFFYIHTKLSLNSRSCFSQAALLTDNLQLKP